MKLLKLLLTLTLLPLLFYSFCGCRIDKRIAEQHIWLYDSGYWIGDHIGFSDTLLKLYRLDENDTIYKGDSAIGLVVSVSNATLVIKAVGQSNQGYYRHFISIGEYCAQQKELKYQNVTLNKIAIKKEISGIVSTKKWMQNGNLQIKLNNNNSDFPNCFLDPQMDSVAVGDSLFKKTGANICSIYKNNGRVVNVRFVNPQDTLL